MSLHWLGPFRHGKGVAMAQLLAAVALWCGVAPTIGADDSAVPVLKLPDASGISIGLHPSGRFVEVKGVLRSEIEAQPIFRMIRSVRPDLQISVDALTIDETAMAVPVLELVPEFIEELALTTHDWYVSSKSGEFMVSGQTDSLVTRAAFQARLNLLRFDDPTLQLRNLICIVAEDDLPDTPRFLPEPLTESEGIYIKVSKKPEPQPGNADGSSLAEDDFEYESQAPEARSYGVSDLELAGLETPDLNSRLAGLLVPDRLDWLFMDIDRALYLNQMPVARVIAQAGEPQALASIFKPTAAESADAPSLMQSLSLFAKPSDKPDLKVLGLIPFSDQSFMLQVSQMNKLDGFARELLSGERLNDDVVLRAQVGGSGTDAFNEWVGSKRVAEVKRMLVDLGVAEDRMQIQLKAADRSDKKPHRVEILVPHHTLAEEATASIFRKSEGLNSEEPEKEPVRASPIMTTPEPLEAVEAPAKPAFIVPTTGPVVLDVE